MTSRCFEPIVRDVSTRTTLTLDDDVAARLMEAVRTTGRPMKAIVNDAIRAGLADLPKPPKRYVVAARPMGLRPGYSLDSISALLDQLEGPEHK